MDSRLVFVLQFGMNLITYSLLMRWYIYPRLEQRDIFDALIPLAFFHSVRTLGLTAIVPGVVGSRVAATTWAHHVAVGDIASVALALLTVHALRSQRTRGILLAWMLNIVGLLDIVNAGYNAAREQIIADAGPQWFVITFGVPALIVTHITMIVLLIRYHRAR